MAEHDLEWFLNNDNEEAFASLSEQQVSLLSKGGVVDYGDTDEPAPESIDPPADAPEPVVLAKDGVHTIPFEEHRAAKDRAQEAEARAAGLEALSKEQAELIESLKEAKAADKGTGATEAQDEVMAKLTSDYPELAETLIPVMKALAEGGSKALKQELDDLRSTLVPIQKATHENALDAHFAAITAAVPDFDALVDSGAINTWVEGLPSYARNGAQAVLDKGTASEVIELFGQYKQAQGIKPAPSAEQIKELANKAVSNAKTRTPATLNDIPAAGTTAVEETPTSAAGWAARFNKMSEKEILAELAR